MRRLPFSYTFSEISKPPPIILRIFDAFSVIVPLAFSVISPDPLIVMSFPQRDGPIFFIVISRFHT